MTTSHCCLRRLPCFLAAAVLLLPSATALWGAEAGAPTADALLDKWTQAVGGKSALEKIQSRFAKGTVNMPAMGLNATIEFKAKAPNKRTSKVDLAGMGTVREGFDGKVAWVSNPGMGVIEKTGAELARATRDAEFHRELKLRDLYQKLEVKGSAKVGDRPAWMLLATPKEGDAETFYFDQESGLLVRQDGMSEGPGGPSKTEVYIEDYRTIEGTKQPFRIRVKQGEMDVSIQFSEMKCNETYPDADFARPTE